MKPYYYVYHYGDKAPRIRHATILQAETEAKRLALLSPGVTLEILMAVGITKIPTPQTFWVDGAIEPHACDGLRDMTGKCEVCGKNPLADDHE